MKREFESLKGIVEAKMETMEASNKAAFSGNETAIERLRTDHERAIGGLRSDNEKAIGGLRADMERLRTGIFMQMVGVVAAGVTILGGFIAILQFLK